MDDPGDERDAATVRTDLLIDQVNALLAKLDTLVSHGSSNTQTVIHKTVGIGPWSAAAVTACFFTFLGLILLAVVLVPDLHDLQAWNDILRAKVARLEATIAPPRRP